MELVELVGYGAAFLTTVAFFPQFMKAYKTRSTKDISLTTFVAFFVGIVLWLVYGLWRGDPVIIAANSATLIIATGILWLKFKYG